MQHQCEHYIDFEVTLPPVDDFTMDEVAYEGSTYLGFGKGWDHSTGVPTVRRYCEAPATVTIVGERDSFGVEFLHFCRGCAAAVGAEIPDDRLVTVSA